MTADTLNEQIFLMHILSCVERIREYTQDRRDIFFDSMLVQDAVFRNLQNTCRIHTKSQ